MKKAPLPLAPKTITWFEQTIKDVTPTTGILASVDQGIWSIAETAGQLAGIWRRHRNQMHDLNDESVTQALGELLAAIVQTAHAVGVPLETIMTEQTERMRKNRHDTVACKTKLHPTTPAREMVEHPSRQSRPRTVTKEPVPLSALPTPPAKQPLQRRVSPAVAGNNGPKTDTARTSEKATKPGKRRPVVTESPLSKHLTSQNKTTLSIVTVGTVTAQEPAQQPRGTRKSAPVPRTKVPVVVAKKRQAKILHDGEAVKNPKKYPTW